MAALLLFATMCAEAADVLFADGRSPYTIVLSADASMSERTAAAELSDYLHQMSGARLPVASIDTLSATGRRIYVGWHEDCRSPRPDAAYEGFTYRTVGHDLHIFGGSERGTMYGVFTFLERELGVRWLTSSCTHVPQLRLHILPRLEHSEQPALRQRLVYCYDALRHNEWVAHNRLNNQRRTANGKYGPLSAFWGIHTFQRLMPPERYFAEHPEYYSLVKGQRTAQAQLCLSNGAMVVELTKNLISEIRKNPGYWCYDLSQNDNRLFCECLPCQDLSERHGGLSGALLSVVNQVAADVAREFPDVYVGTFAYGSTRRPPSDGTTVPAGNVVIRLCDGECCMTHPIDGCERNEAFAASLNQWMKLTPNVYVWDYSTIFYNYLLPLPCFRAMAANYRLFARTGVIGVMEEGAYDAPWSEFSELKQWVAAKLMWTPEQDTDSLAAIFISSYYGAAAPFVQRYYDMCQRRAGDHHLTIYAKPSDPFFDESFATDALWLIEDAVAAAADEATRQRTRRLEAQMRYLRLQRDAEGAQADGSLEKLREIIHADSTIVREHGTTLQKMLDER